MYKINSFGAIQKKAMILLLGGLSLGFSTNPRMHWVILRKMAFSWKQIDRDIVKVKRSLKQLEKRKYITIKKDSQGMAQLILSKEGRKIAKKLHASSLTIQRPKKWDGLWRIVIFDIPEKQRSIRNVFRSFLKRLHFVEIQKSVFVHPYECKSVVEELAQVHEVENFVQYIRASYISNEKILKRRYKL